MTTTPALAEHLVAEPALPVWRRLRVELVATVPPCAAHPDRWWSTDPADVEAACWACSTCPALAACGAYADAAAEPYGVWAGVDRTAAYRATKGIARTVAG